MHKSTLVFMRYIFIVIMIVLITPFYNVKCFADNYETKYDVIIHDDADLLTQEEEDKLIDQMKNISEFGNVGFFSTDEYNNSTKEYASDLYEEYFGDGSGILILIDMYNRTLYILTNSEMRKVITDDYADSITDNVYEDLREEEYYNGITKAYQQIYTLLQGDKIPQPMKYVCNGLLALNIALLIFYFIIQKCSKMNEIDLNQFKQSLNIKCEINSPRIVVVDSKKEKIKSSNSSSTHYHVSGSSRGGFGGGSHGGGSHRF